MIVFYAAKNSYWSIYIYPLILLISLLLPVLITVLAAVLFGIANENNWFYYFKRIWEIIIVLFFSHLIVSVTGMFLYSFVFGGLLLYNPILKGYIFKILTFIAYVALVWKWVDELGYIHAMKKIYNERFLILNMVYAYMLIIPVTICQIILISAPVPHNIFSVHIPIEDPKFNISFMIISIFATIIIEMVIFIIVYKKGRKYLLQKHIKEGIYETDEN